MRLIWSGFLIAGLLLTGFSAYERRQPRERETGIVGTTSTTRVVMSEDGTPTPNPDPPKR